MFSNILYLFSLNALLAVTQCLEKPYAKLLLINIEFSFSTTETTYATSILNITLFATNFIQAGFIVYIRLYYSLTTLYWARMQFGVNTFQQYNMHIPLQHHPSSPF